MSMDGITCGALFSECALLPMKAKAAGGCAKARAADDFGSFLSGVKERHPELFVSEPNASAPAPAIAKPKATDRKSAAASDWDFAEEVVGDGDGE